MAETSKQEVLLSDLSIIQSQVEILANKCKDLTEANLGLDSQVEELKKEKSELIQKITRLETELQNIKEKSGAALLNSVDEKEKEELKRNISDLITRIDFHLSAERQA
jgi:predicted nuclease with TOPRIM domain